LNLGKVLEGFSSIELMKGLTKILKKKNEKIQSDNNKIQNQHQNEMMNSSPSSSLIFDKKSVSSSSRSTNLGNRRYIPQHYKSVNIRSSRGKDNSSSKNSFSKFSVKKKKSRKVNYHSLIKERSNSHKGLKILGRSSTKEKIQRILDKKNSYKETVEKGDNEVNIMLINNIKKLSTQNKELKYQNRKILEILKNRKIIYTFFESTSTIVESLKRHFLYTDRLKKRLKIQNQENTRFKTEMRKLKTFDKYYPENSKQIISENEKSSNHTNSSKSSKSEKMKKSEFSQLLSINKKLGFIPSNFDFELQDGQGHPQKNYQKLLENSNLMEKNIINLKAYMQKKNLEDDISQYISYVLELMKSENDSKSVKYAQILANFENLKEKFERNRKKLEGYKTKWKISSKQFEILKEKCDFFEKKYFDLESENLGIKEYELEIEKLRNLLEFKDKEIEIKEFSNLGSVRTIFKISKFL